MITLLVIGLIIVALSGYFYAPRQGYVRPGYAGPSLATIVVIVAVLYLAGVIR